MTENPREVWIWPSSKPLPSPWLNALTSREGNQHGGQAFWQAVSHRSCPVLETMDGDPLGPLHLTFLWRGEAHSYPWLIGGPSVDHLPLWQIEGSDIWFRSLPVPSDLVLAYRFAQIPPPKTKTQEAFRAAVRQSLTPDPLNPNVLHGAWQGHQEAFSTLELPRGKEQGLTALPGADGLGESHRFAFNSRFLNVTRDIYIQAPPSDLVQKDPQRLLFLLDGERCEQVMQLPAHLAAAQISGQIPATTVVYVGAGRGLTRAQELGCNPAFARALTGELLPRVEQVLGRSFLPAQTQISGASLGGLAALHAALLFPDRFQQVVALSGAFWWPLPAEQGGDAGPDNQVVQRFEKSVIEARAGLQDLRVRLSVGRYETGGLFGSPDMVKGARRVAKHLNASGAEVGFSVRSGGHDPALWRHCLLQDLMSLS
ncbi:alpha/beta hydrolase-fold protein [Pseudophaeobacter sp.]|uniref:alpha/beta hydrolase-fold protein n=1 Tax=Pseudophaeobacter sp. TaxID=1971739 RepID=UPI003296F587